MNNYKYGLLPELLHKLIILYSSAPASAHPDSRCRDNDRYTLIAPVRIIRQHWTITIYLLQTKARRPYLQMVLRPTVKKHWTMKFVD